MAIDPEEVILRHQPCGTPLRWKDRMRTVDLNEGGSEPLPSPVGKEPAVHCPRCDNYPPRAEWSNPGAIPAAAHVVGALVLG